MTGKVTRSKYPGNIIRLYPTGVPRGCANFFQAAEVQTQRRAVVVMVYKCQHCKASFSNFYSLRSHENGNRVDGVPVCELIRSKSVRVIVDEDNTSNCSASVGAATEITNPFDIKHDICRRHQDDSTLGPPHPLSNLGSSSLLSYTGSINYGRLVLAFGEYCRWIFKSRSRKFWSLYLKTRHLPNEDQREILQVVRELFSCGASSKWCPDKRAVRCLLEKKPFWPLVTYTYSCDLTAFQVPGLGVVTYTFVDPIFSWIMQARKLCKNYNLVFRYREARRKGEQTWGSCVSCGEAMRQVNEQGKTFR